MITIRPAFIVSTTLINFANIVFVSPTVLFRLFLRIVDVSFSACSDSSHFYLMNSQKDLGLGGQKNLVTHWAPTRKNVRQCVSPLMQKLKRQQRLAHKTQRNYSIAIYALADEGMHAIFSHFYPAPLLGNCFTWPPLHICLRARLVNQLYPIT